MTKNKNTELGREGEALATKYLQEHGWRILERNYRHRRAEIDLIAVHENLMIFVEVKMRTGTGFGMPEDFVDEKKARTVMEAADHYIIETGWQGDIRFDIIAILKGKAMEIRHFEDAFY